MQKVLWILLPLLLLSGCGQVYQDSKLEVLAVPNQQKSVIIFQVDPPTASFDLVKFANPDGSVYEDFINSKGYFGHAYRFTQFSWWHQSKPRVMFVDAGYYAINNIAYEQGNVEYQSAHTLGIRHIENKKSFIPNWGAFYAPPGKVVYLGNINIKYSFRENTFKFTHVSKPQYIKGYLGHKYPALAEMLEPGAYFPGGISSEFIEEGSSIFSWGD